MRLRPAKFSELDGARIGLWGLGRETLAFAERYAAAFPGGAIEVVADDDPPSSLPASVAGARIVSSPESKDALGGLDLIVRSPGVSIYRPEVRFLIGQGVTVTTATSLWISDAHQAPVIAVSGTKGKSTTSSLLAALLRVAGKRVELCGNIGRPAIELIGIDEPDFYVVELSSYQVADLQSGPDCVVMTSLHPEHADWHGSVRQYYEDKLRLLRLPEVGSVVVNGEDELLEARTHSFDRVLYGSGGDFCVVDDSIVVDGAPLVSGSEISLRGRHNLLNACAALTALRVAGVELDADSARHALGSFEPLPHRLETVLVEADVTWVNDSISTTPEAAVAALASVGSGRVILIAGGFERQQDYSDLARSIVSTRARLVVLPTTGSRLAEQCVGAGLNPSDILSAESLPGAMEAARALAKPGDVVLLSPAAPSYGQFESFVERGEMFRSLAPAGAKSG